MCLQARRYQIRDIHEPIEGFGEYILIPLFSKCWSQLGINGSGNCGLLPGRHGKVMLEHEPTDITP